MSAEPTVFFRLLKTEIEDKGERLAAQVQALNANRSVANRFAIEADAFRQIPGSPIAYWASKRVLSIFGRYPRFESKDRVVKIGLSTSDDFRFVRLWWEAKTTDLGSSWIPLSKGGEYSKFYSDIQLVINWHNNGKELKEWVTQNPFDPGTTHWSRRIANSEYYFRQGLTYPLRTQKGFSARALPGKSIFSHKGPSVFTSDDNNEDLLALLGLMNSAIWHHLLTLQMAFGSYEVGVLQRTPIPPLGDPTDLSTQSFRAYELTRSLDKSDETTHAFSLTVLARLGRESPISGARLSAEAYEITQSQLMEVQNRIDQRVAQLYGLAPEDFVESSDVNGLVENTGIEEDAQEVDTETEPDELLSDDPQATIEGFLMWCLGCAFGRWDVRFALDQSLLPELQGPFEPLPCCSPGMLVGPDGLPAQPGTIVSEAWLQARPNVITLPDAAALDDSPATIPDAAYPLKIAWDGILPDDERHPDDIVKQVRAVLGLLWRERADAIEQEACEILGVGSLREYFRQPRHFFDFHIKRYSKSRRKAPIYWLLQSRNRNYGIWLYYHRLGPDTLYRVGRDYVDAKLNLEAQRLSDLQSVAADLKGAPRRAQERALAAQADLVDEIKTFQKTIDRIARLDLHPDLNDGVLLNIAPLYELVPWKEAQKAWADLLDGKYAWSSISQQLRAKGLVKG